jgi:hypothetical protein
MNDADLEMKKCRFNPIGNFVPQKGAGFGMTITLFATLNSFQK